MTTPVFHSQSPYSNHKVRIPTTNCTGLPKVTWLLTSADDVAGGLA
jgi:hypothetical protein